MQTTMIYQDLRLFCTKSINLVRIEAITIFINKPDLCKQKEIDYKVF